MQALIRLHDWRTTKRRRGIKAIDVAEQTLKKFEIETTK